jgi:hypothetical protein
VKDKLLTWWKAPKSIIASPRLSENPWRTHLIAIRLISRVASWITTTLWTSPDIIYLAG